MTEPKTSIVITTVQETHTTWDLLPTNWQLPCGCIGPDIWSSEALGQSRCTSCDREWKHMGNFGYCRMLDGKPQGKPVLVLKEEWVDQVE